MSESFEIRYLKTAEKDLVDIFDYIAADSPKAAMAMLDKFDRTLLKLAQNPKLGVVPKDDRLRKLGYRMLIIETYLAFYVIKNRTIQVRRIIHGARQYRYLL